MADGGTLASSGARPGSGGVLYVVATPIGNLEDITLRALKVLRDVDLVAAEDTRRTGLLLRHFGIESRIVSVHEHNEKARIEKVIGHLAKGESVALVTDAGTPAVSDPGAVIVAAVRSEGFRIEPIPGPSAVIAALSAAGITTQGFCFSGFPPIRSKDRKRWFDEVAANIQHRSVVFYEAPHRVGRTLAELTKLVKYQIVVGREITKLHEEFVQGTPEELSRYFADPHGEFTIVIPLQNPSEKVTEAVDEGLVVGLFGQLTELNPSSSRRDIARLVAERVGLSAKQVYEIMERHK